MIAPFVFIYFLMSALIFLFGFASDPYHPQLNKKGWTLKQAVRYSIAWPAYFIIWLVTADKEK